MAVVDPVHLRDVECVDKLKEALKYAYLGPNRVCKVYDIPSTGHEYPRINCRNPLNNKNTKVTVGRAALIVKKGTFFIDWDEEEKCEASHLCHNKNCVLLEHIVPEPHSINNSRRTCLNTGFCLGHGRYPQCLVTLKMW